MELDVTSVLLRIPDFCALFWTQGARTPGPQWGCMALTFQIVSPIDGPFMHASVFDIYVSLWIPGHVLAGFSNISGPAVCLSVCWALVTATVGLDTHSFMSQLALGFNVLTEY